MTSASDVRAYATKHGIGLNEAIRRLRRKRLDALLANGWGDTRRLHQVLSLLVEDLYPEDLDRRYPEGRANSRLNPQ